MSRNLRALPRQQGNPTERPATLPYLENPNPLCRVPDPDRLALLTELIETLRARKIGASASMAPRPP